MLAGIEPAFSAGLKIKINAVAMHGGFETEVDDLIRFAHGQGMDLTLIEEMPLGDVSHDRRESHLSLTDLRHRLSGRWTLTPLPDRTGGPARYMRVAETETGGRLGFITPLSCDFCAGCTRLRVSATGELFTCMGEEGSVGLRDVLRSGESDQVLEARILDAVSRKPEGHAFRISSSGWRESPAPCPISEAETCTLPS
ncbi:hypothetical protein [Rhizobium straminoryzae]|uniref:Molybdenum cofactor biosynthesis protein A-like twitch domain-containing protein n=1 Tax=Rhizobium straminoryzae TaxID=1387186 RepID=A0A549TIK7_9HYPH|nr:hypothetical protein [Rhizobium straminoryzae]TRL43227.1 hypothetical protein FNA46_00400 [Rhizobium straminoryzae]